MTVESDAPIEAPTFDQLPLPDSVRATLRAVGYVHPTPVQAAALLPALAGKDLVVQARTGTGKTAAFALPLLSGRVKAEKAACQALVLVPTRELALQVHAELTRLSPGSGIAVTAVYGGAPIGKQIDELARGCHIVVATPGRVLDHLERGTIDPSNIAVLVLDECDEMLSMGFLPQINAIWEQLPKGHQTLLFSATVPREVTRIAQTRLTEPEFITLSGDHIGALEIQHFVYLSQGDKLSELLRILETEHPESAIIFCNTRDETKRVAKELARMGYSADWLNADLSQAEREKVMARTRASELRFLVCTDVAARGIDISHLTHVINFDFPDSSEQYVHRTGRTGRAGKMGTAISLVGPDSIGDLYYLKLKFKIQPIERHLPSARELSTRKEVDLLRVLLMRFPRVGTSDEYRSLARRLIAHDDGESILAGLLRAELATKSAEDAALERRAELPRAERTASEPPPRVRGPAARPVDGAKLRRRRRGARESFDQQSEGIRYTTHDASMPEAGHGDGSAQTPSPVTESAGLTESAAHTENAGATESAAPTKNAAPPETAAFAKRARPAAHAEGESAPYVNLFVNVGRRDGATPDVLKDALASAGVVDGATGRIAIRERHSYVEVPPELGPRVISSLHGSKICGRDAVVEVARPRSSAS